MFYCFFLKAIYSLRNIGQHLLSCMCNSVPLMGTILSVAQATGGLLWLYCWPLFPRLIIDRYFNP